MSAERAAGPHLQPTPTSRLRNRLLPAAGTLAAPARHLPHTHLHPIIPHQLLHAPHCVSQPCPQPWPRVLRHTSSCTRPRIQYTAPCSLHTLIPHHQSLPRNVACTGTPHPHSASPSHRATAHSPAAHTPATALPLAAAPASAVQASRPRRQAQPLRTPAQPNTTPEPCALILFME